MTDKTTAEKFVECLRNQDVLDAIQLVKEELAGRARACVEELNYEVAATYKMTRIAEAEEEEDDDKEDSADKDDDKEDDKEKDEDEDKGKDDE